MAEFISVPRDMVVAAMKGEVETAVFALVASVAAYPDKKPGQIAEKLGASAEVIEAAKPFVKLLKSAPKGRSGGNARSGPRAGGGGQKYDYPGWFGKYIRDRVKEEFGEDAYVPSHEMAERMWEVVGSDDHDDAKAYYELALRTTLDYHENQDEVRSPGGFILRQLENDDRERLEYKVEQIEKHGTVQRDGGKAASKARKAVEEELEKSPPKKAPGWKNRKSEPEPDDDDEYGDEYDEEDDD